MSLLPTAQVEAYEPAQILSLGLRQATNDATHLAEITGFHQPTAGFSHLFGIRGERRRRQFAALPEIAVKQQIMAAHGFLIDHPPDGAKKARGLIKFGKGIFTQMRVPLGIADLTFFHNDLFSATTDNNIPQGKTGLAMRSARSRMAGVQDESPA